LPLAASTTLIAKAAMLPHPTPVAEELNVKIPRSRKSVGADGQSGADVNTPQAGVNVILKTLSAWVSLGVVLAQAICRLAATPVWPGFAEAGKFGVTTSPIPANAGIAYSKSTPNSAASAPKLRASGLEPKDRMQNDFADRLISRPVGSLQSTKPGRSFATPDANSFVHANKKGRGTRRRPGPTIF
jgi:hypothetical protein